MSSLAFPKGKYRMFISSSPDGQSPGTATSVVSGREYNGTIELKTTGGVNQVVILSAGGVPQAVNVSYNSVREKQGCIGPFEVVIDGRSWDFANITCQEFQKPLPNPQVCLVSFQLDIDYQDFNLFAIRTPIQFPLNKKFGVYVAQSRTASGILEFTSNSAGTYTPDASTAVPVTVDLDGNVSWFAGRKFSGFPFGLDLQLKHKSTLGKFGFLGQRALLTGAGDGDDWEATAAP